MHLICINHLRARLHEGTEEKLASIFDPNPNEASGETHQGPPSGCCGWIGMAIQAQDAVFIPAFDLWVTFNYLCCSFMAPIPLSEKGENC